MDKATKEAIIKEYARHEGDTGCDYVIEPGAMTNEPADGHYTVSQINGDCEQLPA